MRSVSYCSVDQFMATHNRKNDVFLSYREEDTGSTFTANLYDALSRKRIKTSFILPREQVEDGTTGGDQVVSPSTLKAIEESRISIVVISKNYAFSTRCLDELVKIIECMMIYDRLVWPIFYNVDPSDVRHQKNSIGEGMIALKKRFGDDSERVMQWRMALSEVANLSGWIYGTEYEYEFIQRVVESAVQSLPRYDVFLSFCGEDTRYSFTGFLYHALRREGFKTFMDDEGLVGGNQIFKTLMEAIEKSRLSIVVFSENYGYSSWCLDELVKIVECMKTKNQLVWPIFYKVEQSEVSNQTKSYGHAMAKHEEKIGKDYNSEKVRKWRSALSEVGLLGGPHIKGNEYEYEIIKKIVDEAIDFENRL